MQERGGLLDRLFWFGCGTSFGVSLFVARASGWSASDLMIVLVPAVIAGAYISWRMWRVRKRYGDE